MGEMICDEHFTMSVIGRVSSTCIGLMAGLARRSFTVCSNTLMFEDNKMSIYTYYILVFNPLHDLGLRRRSVQVEVSRLRFVCAL
jgi:hypothetical protein